MPIEFLNIQSADEIRALMAGLEDEVLGGTPAQRAAWLVDAMLPYYLELNRLTRHRMVPDGISFAVAQFDLRVAELWMIQENVERATRSYANALSVLYREVRRSGDLDCFVLWAQTFGKRLELEQVCGNQYSGKVLCMRALNQARTMRKNNPLWPDSVFCPALATIYEAHVRWYSTHSKNATWSSHATDQAVKLRAHAATCEARTMRAMQRYNCIAAAEDILTEKADRDLKRARRYCHSALALMKQDQKMADNDWWRARAYTLIGAAYVEEESFAREMELERSEDERLFYWQQAKEYYVKAMDAWLNLVQKKTSRGEDADFEREALIECYWALSEACNRLPGEKNQKKSEKYRQKALQ